MVGEVAEHGETQLAVQDHEVVAVAYVLPETSHVGGKGLIGVVLRVIDGCTLVEGGEDPVVDTAHIIDEFLLSKRTAAGNAVGPNEVATDTRVVPVIETDNNHVIGVACDALVVFGKHFSSCPDEQVGSDFLRVVVNQFGTQTTPVFVNIFVGETVIINS